MRENNFRRKDFELAYAREMRRNPTKAERCLWQALRGKRLGVRFRRQQPIGSFVVDFYCSRARLVIELDGDQHGAAEIMNDDEERTHWLRNRGYRVIRFWNGEVENQSESVLARIRRELVEVGVLPSGGYAARPTPENLSAGATRFSDPPSKGG